MRLPVFTDIKPETIENDITAILDKNRRQIEYLLTQPSFTWENLMLPLEDIEDNLHNNWSPIQHMHSVVDSEPLRNAYNACIPKLSDYYTEISHNKKLYEAIRSIKESNAFNELDIAKQTVIENELRDFMLAGVSLSDEGKKQYAELAKALSQLTNQFEQNVLDATNAFVKHMTKSNELSGLPDQAIAAAKNAANKRKREGWVFTLEFPSYFSVITYADSPTLREEMYRAYCTRASDTFDNTPIMQTILEKRLALANLLGFSNYAEYSLATKMARDPQEVLDFLNQLASASFPPAQREFQELKEFAKKEYGVDTLNAWDIPYFSEKLRQHRYNISQEELRPYFPEHRVLEGLFTIVNKLYDIRIQEIISFDKWHDDVRFFELYDQSDKKISGFYLDLYAREKKRGGAWMDDCRNRRRLKDNTFQLPVAYLTCNFNSPINDEPALFTHDEVITLFHEFGHCLQHMLTKMDIAGVSGINGIPWDAVEIASQFMENWAEQKESIDFISQHFKTKEPLPESTFKRMHEAKNYQAAMQIVRQLEFSLFDFQLHMEFDPTTSNQVQSILDDVRSKVSVIPVPSFNRFQNGFSHIFAGGYAAGYYSYKWAEVMAADAFSLFKEKGIFDKETSKKFLNTFLQSGGAADPMDLFIQFRGRKPRVEALLEKDGIII